MVSKVVTVNEMANEIVRTGMAHEASTPVDLEGEKSGVDAVQVKKSQAERDRELIEEKEKRSREREQAKKRDQELVRRTLEGDRSAFRELFEIYRPKGLAIAYDILGSREDAEDVVQESFVKAYLALSNFKGQAAFYTWLFRIIYNMAIDYKRKFARRGGDPLEFKEGYLNNSSTLASQSGMYGDPERSSPYEKVATQQELHLLQGALQALSDEHRAVITLREIEGHTYEEIAEITGASKGTVMSRLHYARKHLQQFAKNAEENSPQ